LTVSLVTALYLSLAENIETRLLWEIVFYWCMLFVPPMIMIDTMFWLRRRLQSMQPAQGKRIQPR
jgi:hypothetical protein